MNNQNKELLTLSGILLSSIIIIIFASILGYMFELLGKIDNIGWILLAYILLCIVFYFLTEYFKRRFLKLIFNTLFLPPKIIVGYIMISTPFLVLQIHLFYYILFSLLIPGVFLFLNEYFDFVIITQETYVYLIITFAVIIATIFNHRIKHLTYVFSPFRVYYSKKLKKFKFKELTDYFISESNIRFLIYFLYFLYLTIFNLFNFENNSFFSNSGIDKSVLSSFLTFLAFDRVISNIKILEFKPTEMLKRMIESIRGEK